MDCTKIYFRIQTNKKDSLKNKVNMRDDNKQAGNKSNRNRKMKSQTDKIENKKNKNNQK